jgi:hypothetical protein
MRSPTSATRSSSPSTRTPRAAPWRPSRKKLAHAAGIVVRRQEGALHPRRPLGRRRPGSKWVKAALEAAEEFDADEIVAESNQGGEMIKMVLEQEMANRDFTIPVRCTWFEEGQGWPRRAGLDGLRARRRVHVGPKEQFA